MLIGVNIAWEEYEQYGSTVVFADSVVRLLKHLKQHLHRQHFLSTEFW